VAIGKTCPPRRRPSAFPCACPRRRIAAPPFVHRSPAT
jgi:hypothetical protein